MTNMVTTNVVKQRTMTITLTTMTIRTTMMVAAAAAASAAASTTATTITAITMTTRTVMTIMIILTTRHILIILTQTTRIAYRRYLCRNPLAHFWS